MKSNKQNNLKQKREKCSNIFKDTYDKCEKNTILRESIEKSIEEKIEERFVIVALTRLDKV